jgi:hypothetical protein
MTLTQQSTRRLRRRHRVAAGALAGGLALSVLAACAGAGGSADTSAGSDTAERAAVGAAEPGSGAPQSGPGTGDSLQAGRDGSVASDASGSDKSTAAGIGVVALQQRRQVRTGQLSVQVRDVDVAVSSARSFATAAQGFVSDEKTSTRPVDQAPEDAREEGGRGPTSPTDVPSVVVDESVLTLRVPQQSLDQVMGQVGGLGVVRSRSQSSQDVTDSYVDTASRVKSQRASVDRVRTLLSRATGIGDVVRLESELSRREADLDALEARLAALDDSTTLATLVVTFNRPGADVPAPQTHDGFLGGLQDGWQALVSSTAVVLQIVGALVPFAVVLALVGLPVWLVLRRRRADSPAPSA